MSRIKPNHSAPSGPATKLVKTEARVPTGVGIGNSVTAPSVVILPIVFLFLSRAANHNAPSEPATMVSATMGMGNSVIVCAEAVQAEAINITIAAKARRRVSVNSAFLNFHDERHCFLFEYLVQLNSLYTGIIRSNDGLQTVYRHLRLKAALM